MQKTRAIYNPAPNWDDYVKVEMYLIILGFAGTVTAASIQIFTAVLANFGSVYLAYILYFVLHDFCVVCVSTYIVNFLLLIVCIMIKNRLVISTKAAKKKRA